MTELARGKVADRPWGLTLGALGVRGLTGVLRMTSEAKLFTIRFENGAVIDATSSLISDSAARVAMTSQLVNPNQFGEAVRLLALMPDRDEYEVVAEVAGLTPAQIDKLRRRVIAQRSARTLSIPDGEFVVTSASSTNPTCALDIRPLIYLGALVHMPEPRIEAELAGLGARFQLRPDIEAELPAYGFTDAERKVVTALETGASIAELEKACPDLDRRTICAVVYVLVSGLACRAVEVAPPITMSRTDTRRVPSKIDPNTSFNVGAPSKPSEPAAIRKPATGEQSAISKPTGEPPISKPAGERPASTSNQPATGGQPARAISQPATGEQAAAAISKPATGQHPPTRLRITVDTYGPPIVERLTPSETLPPAPAPPPPIEPSAFDDIELARKSGQHAAPRAPSDAAVEPLVDSPFDEIDLKLPSDKHRVVAPSDDEPIHDAQVVRTTAAMWAQAPFEADLEILAHRAEVEAAAPNAGQPRAKSRTEQLLVFAAIPREPSSRNMPAEQDPLGDIPLLDDSLLEPLPDEPDAASSSRRWPRAGTESAWLPLDLRRPAGRGDPDR